MPFCLIGNLADEFLKRLKSGDIDPIKLSEMSSKERHEYFKSFLGEDNAKQVNSLFESKMLLKYKEQGYINWAKSITGIKEPIRNSIFDRIQKMKEEILNPQSEKEFLADLAQQRLGVGVSMEETKSIYAMSQKIKDTKANLDKSKTVKNRIEFGAARQAMQKYIGDLKNNANKVTIEEFKKNPAGTITKEISNIAGYAKALKASLDASSLFRQNWKVLVTHPEIWAKNALELGRDIKKGMSGEEIIDGLMADIYSRDNVMNGLAQRAGLDIGYNEEAFPTGAPEKIPAFGKLYKLSEDIYTANTRRTRMDTFDYLVRMAQENGRDLSDDFEVKSLGLLANSLTGRGNLGSLERVGKTVNNIFFSPKFFKSNLDFLTAHLAGDKMSSFARKEAAKNLVKGIVTTAVIMGIAKALAPQSVDFDPRSTNFGKIKIGNTTFDLTGGWSSIAVLASRLVSQSSKSAQTGVVSKLGTGFGQTSGLDVFYNFLENKMSPVASFVKDMISQETFSGGKPTVLGELSNLFTPMPVSNAVQNLQDPNKAPVILGILADAVGISSNTYSYKTDWTVNPTAEISAFQNKVTKAEFSSANDEYNKAVADKIASLKKNKEFISLSSDDQQTVLTNAKGKIKDKILKKYGFVYKNPPKTKEQLKSSTVMKKLEK